MTTRQLKISKQIQKDMAEILQPHVQSIAPGRMLTVTEVTITPDLGLARIHVSVFPSQKGNEYIILLNNSKSQYRNELGKKLRHQLKKIPEIQFVLDDSLDYIANIDNLLKH
jgi:ribosome-binding factor A